MQVVPPGADVDVAVTEDDVIVDELLVVARCLEVSFIAIE